MQIGSTGIRTHLMLTTVGVVIIALGVTYLVVLPLTESMIRTQHIEAAKRIAYLVASEVESRTRRENSRGDLNDELDRWRGTLEPQCIGLASASGALRSDDTEVFERCGSLEVASIALQSKDGAAFGGSGSLLLVVAVPIDIGHVEYGPGPDSRLLLTTSVSGIQARLSALQTIILLFMGLAVLLVTLLGYVTLTHLVVRPLQRVIGALDGHRYGGIGKAEPTGGRELQELATSVNRLGRRLEDDETQLSLQLGELKLINDELEVMKDSLVRSEKLASVGRLAAGVAHEIGNPIGIVLGYLEMLQHPDTTLEQRKKYVQRALEATQRISLILRDLLEFARPEPEHIAEATNVVEAVEAVLNLVQPQKRLSHVTLSLEQPSQASLVLGRVAQRRLEQVLMNLILNAADATSRVRRANPSIRIVVLEPVAGWVTVHVYDNGEGIDEEHRAHIFDPFFSTKEPGYGTGLGLSVCYSIITSAGGDIVVDSTVGQGTCFTITLPQVRSPDA